MGTSGPTPSRGSLQRELSGSVFRNARSTGRSMEANRAWWPGPGRRLDGESLLMRTRCLWGLESVHIPHAPGSAPRSLQAPYCSLRAGLCRKRRPHQSGPGKGAPPAGALASARAARGPALRPCPLCPPDLLGLPACSMASPLPLGFLAVTASELSFKKRKLRPWGPLFFLALRSPLSSSESSETCFHKARVVCLAVEASLWV